MADKAPVVFDDDNPEWTGADFARARPAEEILPQEIVAALRKRGRPPGSTSATKELVSIRLDREVLTRLRATGKGWQSRANSILRQGVLGQFPTAPSAKRTKHVVKDATTGSTFSPDKPKPSRKKL